MTQYAALPSAEYILPIAYEAGACLLRFFGDTSYQVTQKSDGSDVTTADEQAEALIVAQLQALTPNIPIIGEESFAKGHKPDIDKIFWLVDALDGTKIFISGQKEFTVNIALVVDGEPVLGVVYAPALSRLFVGIKNQGAFVEENGQRRSIHCRKAPVEGLTVFASVFFDKRPELLDQYLQQTGQSVAVRTPLGSSLKFCNIAAGKGDLYPRFGRTMEWDTAAGEAVLRAAGGRVVDLDGKPMRYGKKPGFENPAFLALGLP